MSLKVTAQIASLFIASALLASCSSNAKKTTATTTTTASSASTKDAKKSTAKTAKATTTTVASGAMVCKSGSDSRTLEVVAKDGGCELSYTKFDQTSTPATSGNGTAHCESVKQKIKGNLENSGFKCE